MKKLGALVFALGVMAGCGQGNDPLTLLGDSSVQPQLTLPLGSSSYNYILQYNPSTSLNSTPQTGLNFMVSASAQQQTVLAPFSGYISKVEVTTEKNGSNVDQTYQAVTIVHNAHLTTRIDRLAAVTLKAGDFVNQGDTVGVTLATSTAASIVRLSTYYDGVITCPYLFFSSGTREAISLKITSNGVTVVAPCAQ